MKKRVATFLFVICASVGFSALRVHVQSDKSVVTLDPLLSSVVSADSRLEVLKGDYFGFSEGPVWVRDGSGGYLLFSDIAANAIYKWTRDGALSTFLSKAGFTGADASQVGAQMNNGRLTVIFVGSNGLTLDPEGRLLLAAMGDRAIVRIEKDGTRTTLADRYEGKRINGGNDLVARANGSIYFTDGTGGLRGRDKSPAKELSFDGLFLIKDGRLSLLDRNFPGGYPNGIALSPDEKYLYVNSGGRFVRRYEVRPDDSIGNVTLFIEVKGTAPGGTDGMKVDAKGNVFCTGPGGVWIISPEGKHIGTILIPERPATNVAFGDPDGKALYITNQRGLLRIRLNTPGILPGPRPGL